MNLMEAQAGTEYIIRQIDTDDSGEPITVVSHLKGGCVVSIKDARYNIDRQLASAILV